MIPVLKASSLVKSRSQAEKHGGGTAVSVMIVGYSVSFIIGCVCAAGVGECG